MNDPIPILKGANFEFWKFKLTAFFRSEGLEQTLQQPLKCDKSWIRDDMRARMVILESVDDKHVELIMQEASAKDMVDKLEGMYSVLAYSGYSKNSKKKLCHEFLALKLAKGDDPNQFFCEFETHIDMLDAAGDRLPPEVILDCLQMAVSKSYWYLFEKVDPLLEPLEIVKLVKKDILAEYMARTNNSKAVNGTKMESPREKSNPWNTFKETFKDEQAECLRCGQSGHCARQCPQPKECYKCGREGHLRSQCTQQQQETCYGCGQVGHQKFACPDHSQLLQHHPSLAVKQQLALTGAIYSSLPSHRQSYERKGTESPVQHLPSLMPNPVSHPTAVSSPFSGSVEEQNLNVVWILDSCATYHTICDESLFSKYVPLKEPINVEMANGNTLTASKMGEVRVCFRVGPRSTVKVLPNVYLIKEFEQNLLSIQKLVHFGGSVMLKSSEGELRDPNNQVIARGKKQEHFYIIKSYLEKSMTDGVFDAYV